MKKKKKWLLVVPAVLVLFILAALPAIENPVPVKVPKISLEQRVTTLEQKVALLEKRYTRTSQTMRQKKEEKQRIRYEAHMKQQEAKQRGFQEYLRLRRKQSLERQR